MKYVEYHSRDWEHLVEQGWMTDVVFEHAQFRVAKMIRRSR